MIHLVFKEHVLLMILVTVLKDILERDVQNQVPMHIKFYGDGIKYVYTCS